MQIGHSSYISHLLNILCRGVWGDGMLTTTFPFITWSNKKHPHHCNKHLNTSSNLFTYVTYWVGLNFCSKTGVFIFAIFAFLMFSPCVTFIAMKFNNMILLWPSLKSHFYYEWKKHAKINIMILGFKTYFLWFRSMPKTNRLIL